MAAIVALAVDRDNSPKYWITAAVTGVSIYASLTLANAIWILQEVVGIATRQNERQA